MGAMLMEKMTWPDIRSKIEQGKETVVWGLGSIEQHGLHLPISTDSLLADALSFGLAEKLNAFVAPTLKLGCSKHHMAFAGTLTLSTETYKNIIKQTVDCFLSHGFKKVVLVPSHGGNFAPLKEFVEEYSSPKGVLILAFTDLEKLVADWKKMAFKRGISSSESGAHAGENETSALLYLHPELVKMKNAKPGFVGDHKKAIAKVFSGIQGLSDIGVIGDPRKATKQAGEEYIKGLVEMLFQWVKSETL